MFVFFCYVENKKEEYKIKVNAGESHCPKRLVVLGFQSQWPPPPGPHRVSVPPLRIHGGEGCLSGKLVD